MPTAINDIMESASLALAQMDYPRCEALCIEAMARARDSNDWPYYQRILMPLQEARRQKRQAALDGDIRLGTEGVASLLDLLEHPQVGCIVVTHPFTKEDADRLDQAVRMHGRSIEVLFADNAADAPNWKITSFRGPAFVAQLPAPDRAWVNQWASPTQVTASAPAHWFMQANEALGNAGIESVLAPSGTDARVDGLERILVATGDHELAHQALADAANAMYTR